MLLALLMLMALGLGACRGATPQMAFYTLSPIQAESAGNISEGPAVGVGPLVIPRTIDRPHIVTREGTNQLRLSEFHRWGGPLKNEILHTLARNLSTLLPSEQVVAHPWTNFIEPEYPVPVEILRLDGTLGGEVALTATWGVAEPGQRRAETVHTFRTTIPVDGNGYPALVTAHNQALAALSTAIAEEIKTMQTKN